MNRIHHVVAVMTVAISVAANVRGETRPFKARISVPAATVQSGPSDGFYATDTLAERAQIEVYREEKNGWCAIRPPEGSFSWVYSRHVRELDESVGEITKDDVASRIGSRMSDHRNAVQIRLKRGEMVHILDKEEDENETWYKIAPPAGEFRWIHRRNFERSGEIEVPDERDNQIVTVAVTTDEPRPKDARSSPTEPATTVPEEATTSETSPAAGEQWRASADSSVTLGSAEEGTQAQRFTSSVPAGGDSPNGVAPNTTEAVRGNDSAAAEQLTDIGRQIAEIELQLSRTVVGPPRSWNIEALERAAEQLLPQAQTMVDRNSIETTLEKLNRFATIQRRYARNMTPGSANGGMPGVIATIGADGARYDAVGVLRPVVSKRPGAPQYALVDDRGQVVSFVTPTPDVNLQPYLGHRVGIAGSRSFIPEFNRAHVTAGRVAPVVDRLVR